MGIVTLATIIDAAATAAIEKSDRLTVARKNRTSGRWYYMYRRELELFRLHCLLSGRGL